MSAESQELPYKLNTVLEKRTQLGDPASISYMLRCILQGTDSVRSLVTLTKGTCGKKESEINMSILLMECMGLLSVDDDCVKITEILSRFNNRDEEALRSDFEDCFIDYVMNMQIIDIECINYEIDIDAFVMSHGSIVTKYAGFRNLLINFDIIEQRNDAKYVIKKKLDKYLSIPKNHKRISEKQLLRKLQQEKEQGDAGEIFVLSYEHQRLLNPGLVHEIKRISTIDVGAGYDIVSFNSEESLCHDRFIEVKTYKGNEHFYWSENEIKTAHLMGNQYFLYLVDADCIDKEDYEPTIIQDPVKTIGEGQGWIKRPSSYYVERYVKNRQSEQLPLFTNVKEFSIPEHKTKVLQMAAESHEITELDRNEIFKISLLQLFNQKDYTGKTFFSQKSHWEAVYRVAVDENFAIENDYKGMVSFIQRLSLEKMPYTFNAETIKKADIGVFTKPWKEWTLELYKKKNNPRKRKPFDEMYMVAECFHRILTTNLANYKKTSP